MMTHSKREEKEVKTLKQPPLTQLYTKYLIRKGTLMGANVNLPEEIKDFENAENYLRRKLAEKNTKQLSTDEFIVLIQEIHKIISVFNYSNKYKESKPGNFRKDIGFILRHPIKHADYTSPDQFGRITHFLEKSPVHGKQTALNFLLAYYKQFIVPTNNPTWIKNFREYIVKYYQKLFNSENLVRFTNCIDTPLSPSDIKSLELIYHFFLPHTEIEKALRTYFIDLSEQLKMEIDPADLFVRFYTRFIEIHPFSDANSRTIKLLLNTILIERGYQPTMLEEKDARLYTDYYYNKNPNPSDLLGYVRSLIKTSSTTKNVSALSEFYINCYHKSINGNIHTIFFKPEDRVYLPDKIRDSLLAHTRFKA